MIEHNVTIPQTPLVVGSVATLNHLACLQPVELPSLCDILEIRLDGMAQHMEALQMELDRFKDFPLLFTARCAAEGGLIALSATERSELLLAVADRATWIDVELASFNDMTEAIHRIRCYEVGLILSYHNFEKTPAEFEMQRLIDLSEEADIIKFAVRHHSVDDPVGILQAPEYRLSHLRPELVVAVETDALVDLVVGVGGGLCDVVQQDTQHYH